EGSLPILIPITASDCFQVFDGHHRAAIARARGEKHIRALVRHSSVKTRLQEMLVDVAWQQDRHELYQPVDAPELSSWPLVRRCSDRLAMVTAKLSELGINPAGTNYLDVGSSYGWFVAEMNKRGFDAHGVDLDRFATLLAAPL